MPAPQKVKLPPRRKKKCEGFGWGAWLTGLIMGVTSTWLIMSDLVNVQELMPKDNNGVSRTTPVDTSNDIVDNLPIEFYKLLPSREEQVPVHVISQQVREASPSKPMDKPGRYRLQAGSFQKIEDADRRRASILILGLNTHIEKVSHGGRTWHRVMLGPFESLKQLEIARRRMHENKIDTIVLKLKN
jgi:cell division protein FtsN